MLDLRLPLEERRAVSEPDWRAERKRALQRAALIGCAVVIGIAAVLSWYGFLRITTPFGQYEGILEDFDDLNDAFELTDIDNDGNHVCFLQCLEWRSVGTFSTNGDYTCADLFADMQQLTDGRSRALDDPSGVDCYFVSDDLGNSVRIAAWFDDQGAGVFKVRLRETGKLL